MRLANRRWAVARILFGLFFLYAPLMVIVQFGGQNPPETMPAASDFASALDRTGFMNPLIIGTMLMGGAALLFERSAPVGLILLGPSIAVIAGFHWFLTGKLVWGSIWPVWFLLLVWHHRDVFSRLWVPRMRED
ncbi:hypothetical protein [Sphingopyxis panaciterrulae]|uniref:DoxX family protein n=1 Tax=Sphingopyxis panaciterrulae TaxID=462372 RepID=A0A7W9B5S8_9SPHN|nr:hypothetical protein [Sphingopyxis panaciterrulae]MBB5706506.1 hypothetical protein [Sphingopyxis panaciterrulae]